KHFQASTAPPVVMLHGLFGSMKNFGGVARNIAKLTGRPVHGLDLRNHGLSPHASPHNYLTLAHDVIHHITNHSWREVVLVGHSMGAKAAMVVSLLRPDLVGKLVVVDNSPVNQQLEGNFYLDLEGMCKVEEAYRKDRELKMDQIDDILANYEPDPKVRFFLKTNLYQRPQDHLFKVPVLNFEQDHVLRDLGEWPAEAVDGKVFTKPTVVMAAKHSNFIRSTHRPAFEKYFPQVEFQEFDCGHWIVTDKPNEFVASM
ncbi:alpha/beta-hydrolase, partial [Suhomyces tanzawaensis NRRL Y-17324]